MIGVIRGEIIEKDGKRIIVDTGGVGYSIYMTETDIISTKIGESVFLYTYMAVKENAIELYGFFEEGDKEIFERLLSVSGIGPRSALSILGIAPRETLLRAISSGDSSYLTQVSGIGKKTAEKIVLELRDQLKDIQIDEGLRGKTDALEALISLGYKKEEARDAIKSVSEEIEDLNEMIREALKIISKS
ncbi:Holliday junction branch migration protein RuvA [Candidatus Nomurabacteria bacterium]|nr:Holliday junction branch migration protein RuvA [Candidatus Nomurabacteria bacterium]USN94644.1 MAG: Holliday junction branch migration protein RuvA [Candidatus Nomurabacteria bacterium]